MAHIRAELALGCMLVDHGGYKYGISKTHSGREATLA